MSAEICNVAADVSSHHTAAWYDTDPEIDDDTHHRKSSTSGSNSNKHWSAVSIPSLVHMEEQNAVDSSPGLMPLPIEKLPDSKADKRGRRKSWHIRADRKRRKGVTSPTNSSPDGHLQLPGLHERQKRPSWWNIFVPDHWPSRSRRASQDITRTTDQFVPWQRSKSRSVDHGFSPPFDLDSLRSKVEGRFDSVEKLAKDAEAKEAAAAAEKKPVKTTPPIQTIIYTVEASDTLTSVAARFDTTPSELKKLNRLPAGTVFPGQELRVPDKRGQASDAGSGSAEGDIEGDSAETGADRLQDASARDESEDLLHAQTSQEDEILDTLRPVSPKLPLVDGAGPSSGPGGGGGGGGGSSASSPRGSNAGCTLDEVQRAARFLKINVRHITDGQGVVSGVLLVTPNAVMFDPNVSDPLVIEHGPESYGVIAPMEFAVNVAIYHDIAHMRVGHHANNRVTNDSKERPEIYYAKPPASMQQSQPDSLLAKDETFPELQDAASSSTVVGDDEAASTGRTDGDAFPKAFDRELVTPTNLDSRQVSIESCGSSSNGLKSSPTPLIDMEERRRSILDHHWAVPRSIEKEDSKDDSTKDELKEDAREEEEEEIKDKEEQPRTSTGGEVLDESDRRTMLVKLSCHDSGIDIRDEVKEVIAPTKKSFSDADIILAPKNEFIPPLTTEAIAAAAAAAQAAAQANGRKKTSSVSFSVDSNPEHSEEETSSITAQGKDEDKQESKRNKMFKRLSYPLAWMEGLTGDSKDDKDGQSISGSGVIPPTSGDSNHSSVFSKVFSRRSSMGSALAPRPGSHQQQRTVAPKLNYHSMVSVDDMPELFVSFDKLIPRPARSCEDPPLYLRLRMGKPKARKIPKSTPIMSYGKKKMRPEYWFSVPRNRVDDLYGFLQLWVPHLYGPLEMDQVSSRGFELVESDTELWEDESPTGTDKDKEKDKSGTPSELADLTRESWEMVKAPYVKIYSIIKTQTSATEAPTDEVLSMSEELRRALYATSVGSIDQELLLPDLVGTTEILSEEHRTGLCGHLPARAEGYVWTLVFSTSQHGFSLNSMYRKMMRLESPILMVIEDTEGNVFGALTSCSFHVSDHFYGTGESLLFRFSPKLEVYNWTGDNMYFIKGNNESLAIGAGDGKFGLWLDGDLYLGRTQPCNTYGNEPLAPQEDFVVKTLECWAFL